MLFVGPGQVEWLEPGFGGDPVLARGAVLGSTPGDVARAALELVRSIGRKPKDCVLVLADELLKERVVPLAPMPDRERRAALRRKAANLTEAKERATVLGALRLGQEAPAQPGTEGVLEKWLLVARERSYIAGLQLHLRRQGFRVRRVLPARFVALCHPAVLSGDDGAARVVVGIEPEAAIMSLIRGGRLVHQTVLQGRFEPGSSLGTTLVQELRGLDLFWRKASRGESVSEVLVLGIEPIDSASLHPAICAALPGTCASLHPDTAALLPDAGRIEVLTAALHGGPFALDLAVPLPPRPRSLAVLTGALGLVAAIGGVFGIHQLELQRETWRTATQSVDGQALDLPDLVMERTRREEDLLRVRSRRERLAALDGLGLPIEGLLLDIAEAFRGRGVLTTLAFTSGPRGLQVDATGVTTADPMQGYIALEELRRTLEASPHYAFVSLTPPTVLPERRTGGVANEQQLSFGIQALGEVGR